MPDGLVATPCRAMRAAPHADSVWSSQFAKVSVSRSSMWPRSEARRPFSTAVADAEGNDRAGPVMAVGLEVGNDDSTEIRLPVALEVGNDDNFETRLPVELWAGNDDNTEMKLPVYEKLAEADAKDNDEPILFVLKHPVSVMYAIDEAFVKAVL